MFFVYILTSEKGRWYVGMTEDIAARLKEHNAGRVRSTKAFRPYKILHTEEFTNKSEALKRERQIKDSGIIRRQLKERFQNTAPSSNG